MKTATTLSYNETAYAAAGAGTVKRRVFQKIVNIPGTRFVRLFNLDISLISYESCVKVIIDRARRNQSGYCCFVNAHVSIEANDLKFANMVNRSLLSVSDGMSLVFALRFLYGIRQDRIAGMDMIYSVLDECNQKSLRVFIFGGAASAQQAFEQRIESEYPGIEVAGKICPPFGPIDSYDNDSICEAINASGAQVVFVCLGCPKQEEWMARYSHRVNAVMLGIGGAMPVFSGQVARAPLWMQRGGLEWLFRLMAEPRRLWKRYFVTNSLFIYQALKQKLSFIGESRSYTPEVRFAKPSEKKFDDSLIRMEETNRS